MYEEVHPMITPVANAAALNDLMSKAESKRVSRALGCQMQYTEWTGSQWQGKCPGSEGALYEPRITLVGQRSFNCTCQDKTKRARQVGPCKHVICLAMTGWQMLVEQERPLKGSIPVVAA